MAGSFKSSFQKKVKGTTFQIPGTRSSVQNAQLLISSGAPSFDHVIGGGIPVGAITLIEEDRFGTFAKLLVKYFLAEGILCSHHLFIGSQDINTEQLVCELPAPVEADTSKQTTNTIDSEMVIAWRYENLQTVESTMSGSQHFGHFFDLTKTMSKSLQDNCNIKHWKCSTEDVSNKCSSFEDSHYYNLLKSISESVEQNDNKNIVRIGLINLGSPLWPPPDNRNLTQFLYYLRAMLRSSFASCMITVPVHLLTPTTVSKCEHLSDFCIKLDSFTGTSLEKNQSLRDYHGFFKVVKLAAINTLVPHVPSTLDLAFKLRRKKLVIEKLHLPPELDDSTEREQDDLGSLSCSSVMGRKLDF